jgi:hypothetical protein
MVMRKQTAEFTTDKFTMVNFPEAVKQHLDFLQIM